MSSQWTWVSRAPFRRSSRLISEIWGGRRSVLLAGDGHRVQTRGPIEAGVAERADTGLGLGPLAKAKVVELALEAREFVVLEVLGEDVALEPSDTEELDRRAVL